MPKKAKENVFIKRARQKDKPNPFMNKGTRDADGMAELREIKAKKAAEEEAARVAAEKKALPLEVKELRKTTKAAVKEYEDACKEANKIFKQLDKLKDPNTEKYATLWREMDVAERRSSGKMANLLSLSQQLRFKEKEMAS